MKKHLSLLPALLGVLMLAGFACPGGSGPDLVDTSKDAVRPTDPITAAVNQAQLAVDWFLGKPEVRFVAYSSEAGGSNQVALADGLDENQFHLQLLGGMPVIESFDGLDVLDDMDIFGINVPGGEELALDLGKDGTMDLWFLETGAIRSSDNTITPSSHTGPLTAGGFTVNLNPIERGLAVTIPGDVSWDVERRASDHISTPPSPDFINSYIHHEKVSEAKQEVEFSGTAQRQDNLSRSFHGSWTIRDNGFFTGDDILVDIYSGQEIVFSGSSWVVNWDKTDVDESTCLDLFPGDGRCSATCEFPSYSPDGKVYYFTEWAEPTPPETSTGSIMFFAPSDFIENDTQESDIAPDCDQPNDGFYDPFALNLPQSGWMVFGNNGFFPNDTTDAPGTAFFVSSIRDVDLGVPMAQSFTIFADGFESGDASTWSN